MTTYTERQKACIDRVREALPEFAQQDDYLLAHGASLMSESSHEIIHIDTLRKMTAVAQGGCQLLRSVEGDEFVRGWLESALADLANPPPIAFATRQ